VNRAKAVNWDIVSGIVVLVVLGLACGAAGPATGPATAPADRALWAKLTDIDARAARVHSLAADFQQQKYTALLRKPLVSSGRVRVKGAVMRWDTQKPEPNVLLIDQHEAKIFYPAQKTIEVYSLDQRLGELASSPLPRLDALKARFSFEQIPVKEMDPASDPNKRIGLRLTPTDPAIREHVKQVRVLLDVESAYILKAEVTDSDGDPTVLTFSQVRLNADVGDLDLKAPPGTTVSHPLEGLEGSSPQSQDHRP